MCVRNRLNSTVQLRLGLVFLILANVISFIGRRVASDIDLATGVLFGVAFGFIILSITRKETRA
jgi:hypothetical protein